MVAKTTKNNQQLFTRRPGFALRMLKLVFTYLTGMINHIPFLPETIKNKLNLVKNTENNVLPIKNKTSSSLENTSKTVKTENENNIEFPVYITEQQKIQPTCDYRNKRPSSLKFNNNNNSSSSAGDSGVSDLSCSNSNVSTPEIEFRTRKKSRSRNRKKSQNNNNTKIMTDQSNNTEQQQILQNSNIVNIEQEKVVAEETVQNKQTTNELKNTSVQRNSTKNNILFDLPDKIHEINLLENEENLESDEIDEELERFKMYCQETNKLFDLNDSKIVIKWETI